MSRQIVYFSGLGNYDEYEVYKNVCGRGRRVEVKRKKEKAPYSHLCYYIITNL